MSPARQAEVEYRIRIRRQGQRSMEDDEKQNQHFWNHGFAESCEQPQGTKLAKN